MSGTWPLYSTHAARALDERATHALGGDPYVLMQRAGLAAWQHVLLHWPEAKRSRIRSILKAVALFSLPTSHSKAAAGWIFKKTSRNADKQSKRSIGWPAMTR